MKKIMIISLSVLAAIIISCSKDEATPQPASFLFFANYPDSSIGKIDLKNSNTVSTFAKGIPSGINNNITVLALNSSTGDLYGTDEEDPGTIYKISSGGTVSVLYSGALANSPAGIAFNSVNNKVYWNSTGSGIIYSMNADGSGSPVALYGGADVDAEYGLTLDVKNGKLYFTNFDEIYAGNLDGTGLPVILYGERTDTIESPSALVLDVDNNKIYWTDESTDVIACANLNGSGNFKILFNNATHGVERSDGLAVDFVSNKIYWSETNSNRIRVGNLDGTGTPVTLVSNVESYSILLK
ncbi:MAG: hypothetical protein KAX69_06150 [Chitinophagales bacterium]|nr:hypothetical protein [Chitinophagales bacterium]